MRTIEVSAESGSYNVMIGSGLLSVCGEHIAAVHAPCRAAIVTDDTVNALYGDTVERSLCEAGFSAVRFVFPHGEQSKTLATYGALQSFLAANRLTRSDLIVALGGGVVGDLAGFAAATYQRGISFVQLPTTLLASVDSSVGGKTAVDLPEGKNLCGCFYQPKLVLCDHDTLKTLPAETFSDGMAEVIKYALMEDGWFFRFLQGMNAAEEPEAVIARCVEMKRDIVAQDEFDKGLRQKLNLGHTVGHAIEKLSGYSISHGAAVGMGLAAVTRAAQTLGYCEAPLCEELQALLAQYGLRTECPYDAAAVFEAACGDKKVQGSSITLVVPRAMGICELQSMPTAQLLRWIEAGV